MKGGEKMVFTIWKDPRGWEYKVMTDLSAKLREMIASGDIAIASTPNGRNKVLASSVTKCIERLQGRAV